MQRARILLVEDEGIIAEDIQMSLQDFGYEVCAIAATGEDAVAMAQLLKPDLVLMDVVLQGSMDGIEAAHQINSTLKIPVVYLTAYADNTILERAKITEPFGYLTKPFRDVELHSTIEMALCKHDYQSKLMESEEWLSVTLSSVADALIATDQKGSIRFMNAVAESLTGWTCFDATGRALGTVLSLVGGNADESMSEFSLESFQRRSSAVCLENVTLTSRNGSSIPLEVRVAPIRNIEKRIIGLVVVFRDISERLRNEKHLRLLSEMVQQSSEGIAFLKLDHSIVFSNKAFAEVHGYTCEELMNRTLESLNSPQEFPNVAEMLEELTTKECTGGECWNRRKDGSLFPCLMHNNVLKSETGEVIGIITTVQDITAIKATELSLRASHEALAEYSSSLAAKVEERTIDLENSRAELKRYSESLEKTNEALKIIIEGIEEQKRDVEKKISHNLNLTISPILDQLKTQNVPDTVHFLIKSLEFNLTNMFSSFGFNMVKDGHVLTPREIRICEMIRSGLSSKQIAKVMSISPQTVLVHRKNIRKKLSLGNSRQNLASFLKLNL
jgi:PAS domain S-box-containing protein